MKEPYSLEELLADLNAEEAQPDPGEDYRTPEQWGRHWGVSVDTARRIIATALKNGKMERRQRTITRINGSPYPQPVYGFTKKEA